MDLYKEEAILEYKLEEGMKKGREEGKIEAAKAMLVNSVDVNIIVECTGLSISEIKELSKN